MKTSKKRLYILLSILVVSICLLLGAFFLFQAKQENTSPDLAGYGAGVHAAVGCCVQQQVHQGDLYRLPGRYGKEQYPGGRQRHFGPEISIFTQNA